MRCPSCSARNADHASWCTQCYARFADPDPDPGPGPGPGAADASPGAAPGAGRPPGPLAVPTPAAPTRAGGDRDIRLRGELVEWRCRACDGWTALAAPACATCASPRSGFGPTDVGDQDRAAVVGLGPALAASALLPGLGHLLTGFVGRGLGRMLLWLLWAGGGVAMTVSAGVTPGAVVLLVAALALWAVSLVDLRRQAAGQPVLADGRILAWSVVGVTLLLVGAVLAGTAGQRTP